MFLTAIFTNMQRRIRSHLESPKSVLSRALLLPIMFAFILTFSGARFVSHFYPEFYYFDLGLGRHVHHFTYGFFILFVSGYLALLFDGPRAKFWIALLHGLGLGLSLDEFGMWLRLDGSDPARWSYDGLIIINAFVFLVVSIPSGVRLVRLVLGKN